MAAAGAGHRDVVAQLLDLGADMEAKDNVSRLSHPPQAARGDHVSTGGHAATQETEESRAYVIC